MWSNSAVMSAKAVTDKEGTGREAVLLRAMQDAGSCRKCIGEEEGFSQGTPGDKRDCDIAE